MTTEQKNLVVGGTVASLGLTLAFVILMMAMTRLGMLVAAFINACPI